jgi:hypothetical protein
LTDWGARRRVLETLVASLDRQRRVAESHSSIFALVPGMASS